MEKRDYINRMYQYLKTIGVINLKFALSERDRLGVNKNVFIMKNAKELSESRVFKIRIKKLATEENKFIRNNGETICLPQYLDLVKDENKCNEINKYIRMVALIIENNKLDIEEIKCNIEELNDVLILNIIYKNDPNKLDRIVPLYLNNYISMNSYINTNKITGINYVILSEDKINEYQTITFNLGINYRYILIEEDIKIFRTWREVSEYKAKE